MLNSLVFTALLRGLVASGATVVATNGWMSGEDYQTAIGAITAIGTIAYSAYKRTTAQQIKDTESLPKVSHVIKK